MAIYKLSVTSYILLYFVILHQGQSELPSPPTYVFSLGGKICSYSVSTPNVTSSDVERHCFFNFRSSASHYLDMNFAENLLYVATQGNIYQLEFVQETTDKDKLLVPSAGTIRDISVDWITGNIYYVDIANQAIRVVASDGSYAYTVLEYINGIYGLAVDPINRFVFWTTTYSSAGHNPIGKSNLDGSGRQDDFFTDVYIPHYLVIDHSEKRLYWTSQNSYFGSIESVKVDGTDHRIIYQDHFIQPYSLTVYQDHVVWIEDSLFHTIYWTKKSSGTHSQYDHIFSFRNDVQDIMLFGDYSQPSGHQNGCSINNGGCEHLCFATSATEVKCVCSLGYELAADNKQCIPVTYDDLTSSILVGDKGLGRLFFMDVTTQQLSSIPLPRQTDITDVAIDPAQEYIFWSNDIDATIMYSSFNGSSLTTVKTFQNGHYVVALAVDYVKELIFFGDRQAGVLASITYNGDTEKTLLSENDTVAIVPDIQNEMLYVAIYGSNRYRRYRSRILRIPYDGNVNNQHILISRRINRPRTLAVDFEAKQMYWADLGTGKIETSDLEGNSRRQIAYMTWGIHLAGMTILGDYIYLSDWKYNNQLIRMDRKNNYKSERFGTDQFLHTTAIEAYPLYQPPSTQTGGQQPTTETSTAKSTTRTTLAESTTPKPTTTKLTTSTESTTPTTKTVTTTARTSTTESTTPKPSTKTTTDSTTPTTATTITTTTESTTPKTTIMTTITESTTPKSTIMTTITESTTPKSTIMTTVTESTTPKSTTTKITSTESTTQNTTLVAITTSTQNDVNAVGQKGKNDNNSSTIGIIVGIAAVVAVLIVVVITVTCCFITHRRSKPSALTYSSFRENAFENPGYAYLDPPQNRGASSIVFGPKTPTNTKNPASLWGQSVTSTPQKQAVSSIAFGSNIPAYTDNPANLWAQSIASSTQNRAVGNIASGPKKKKYTKNTRSNNSTSTKKPASLWGQSIASSYGGDNENGLYTELTSVKK